MSLAKQFEAYAKEAGKNGQRLFGFEDLQRAFYAGAEAYRDDYYGGHSTIQEIEAEIDHFRSHK